MTETTNSSSTGSQGLDQLWEALRRTGVRRPRDDRWLGGVCAGTAHRIGVDPALLRVALVLLLLLGGAGVVAYAVALVLLPDEDGRIELERAAHGDLTGTTVGAVGLLLLGLLVPGPWDLWRTGLLIDGGDLVGTLLVGTLLLIGLAYLPRIGGSGQGSADGATVSGAAPSGATVSGGAPGGVTVSGATAGGATTPGQASPAPRPPVPPRPQRRGPSAAVSSAAAGLALLAAGGAWFAADAGLVDGRSAVLAGCAALVVLGLVLVALGVAGRRDGPVGGTAMLALVCTLAVLFVPSWRTTQLAGDVTWRPTTEAAAERGGTLGLGDATLDLSGLVDLPAGADVAVPVRVGVGELQVVVPDGLDVTVRGSAGVGSAVRGPSGIDADEEAGVGVERTLTRSTDPQVVVDARIGVGVVRLVDDEGGALS